jgi:septum formation protein
MPSDGVQRNLILASTSRRRHDLLLEAGYDFVVVAPSVEEVARPDEAAEALSQRLALEKALDVAGRSEPGDCVLAADTIVVLGEQIFGKPRDAADAERMLLELAGVTHRVLTGFALICVAEDARVQGVATSHVTMRELARAEVRAYAASEEPLDKAGGYAVQGEAGRFVAAIEGLRSNVIGLPVEEIAPALARFGVSPR